MANHRHPLYIHHHIPLSAIMVINQWWTTVINHSAPSKNSKDPAFTMTFLCSHRWGRPEATPLNAPWTSSRQCRLIRGQATRVVKKNLVVTNEWLLGWLLGWLLTYGTNEWLLGYGSNYRQPIQMVRWTYPQLQWSLGAVLMTSWVVLLWIRKTYVKVLIEFAGSHYFPVETHGPLLSNKRW